MSHYINTVRIRAALSILADIHPTDRLDALKKLTRENGGRWDLPTGNYQPFIKTIEVYGVHAMANDLADLTRHWIAVAKTIIAGIDLATTELLPAQDPQCEASGPTKPEGMDTPTPPAFFATGRTSPKLRESAWKPKVGEPILYQNTPIDGLKAGTISAIEYAPHTIEVQDSQGVLSRINPRLIRPIDPHQPQGGEAVVAPVSSPPPEATGADIEVETALLRSAQIAGATE
jgi:hypothetical protein